MINPKITIIYAMAKGIASHPFATTPNCFPALRFFQKNSRYSVIAVATSRVSCVHVPPHPG